MFKTKITPILAVTALAVAVFGSTPLGHAAGNLIARNSVGAAQLKPGAVNAAKLRTNAVTSAKVKNGSLLAVDFKAGQLPTGAQGPKGDKGAQGDRGPAGISALEIVVGPATLLPPGEFGGASAQCPAGKKVIAGGGGSEGDFGLSNSGPPTDHSWGVNARNTAAYTAELYAYAICAVVS